MPWLARSPPAASSSSSRPSSNNNYHHRHRRHYSSVADDDDEIVTRQASLFVALSPLSPRWSLPQPDGLEKEQEDEVEEQDDVDEPPAMVESPPSSPPFTGFPVSPSPRASVLSTVSMASTTTTSTTATLRRFWSPSPSSPSLPSMASSPSSLSTSSPTLSPGGTSMTLTSTTAPSSAAPSSSAGTVTAVMQHTAPTSGHLVTYVPPLVDGAGGTLPRWQRASTRNKKAKQQQRFRSHNSNSPQAASAYSLLWADLRWLARAAPELLRLAVATSAAPLLAVLAPRVWSRPLAMPVDAVADAAEAVLQVGLAVFELGMLAAAPALFLCLPGGLFLLWLAACLVGVRLASWPLNGGSSGSTSTVYRGPWSMGNNGDDDDDDEEDDEHWFFVSGMGATSRSLAKTGPRVAGVFGRPVALIRPGHTYGAVADVGYALCQRLLLPFCVLPSPGADTLYAEVRHALVSSSSDSLGSHDQRRVVVLAHNMGATAVSQALTRLLADVPAARLAQLEIYTFGSLAPDFVLPSNPRAGQGSNGGGSDALSRDAPHVEHVAHTRDPCARFGVLRSVREDLAGRYCGGVFVLGSGASTGPGGGGGGLGISSGLRQVGRGRNFSPPLSSSAAWSGQHRNRHQRMSFPFSYQQQQQYQQHSQLIRRSVSTTSSLTSDSSRSSSSEQSSFAEASSSAMFSSFGSMFSSFGQRPKSAAQRTMLSMEDYLTALFGPEPWSMRPDMDGDGALSSDAYFLDAAICVDRELAEKREMAAMTHSGGGGGGGGCASIGRAGGASSTGGSIKSKNAHHRLSWTGLGATAKYGTTKGASVGTKRLADTDGLLGLETVRRLCKECDGRPGRDVSLLAGYFSEAVVRHRERFGF